MMAILAWLLVGVAAVPVLVLAAECVAAAAGGTDDTVPGVAPPFAVIMPAHDEAAGIARSITAALAQLRPGDRLIVVADNCSDDTAAVARGLGAEVVERYAADLRGKGFALAAGRAALGPVPPPVVIVLDADCIPAAGALPRLAAEVARTGAVVQGCYLLSAREMQGPGAQISNFAFAVKNLVRQRGLARLGAPALLQGTGMGFPTGLFDARRLASPSLVEDMELGLGLVLAGHRVRFLEGALFTSAASARDATMTQRTRWEHGSIVTGWRHAPLLVAAALQGRPALLLLALDLIVPPLALLAGLLAVALLVGAVVALAGGGAGPLLGGLAVAGLFVASIGLAWRLAGREFVAARTLLRVPGYMLWKLPIYGRLLVDRQRAWVRTRRDA